MKSASAGLIALLNSQTFLMADLLTINMVNGSSLYYCNWDTDLVVGGVTYLSGDAQFSRTKSGCKTGINVDTMTVTLYAQPNNLILGAPVMEQIRNGLLDAAQVKVDRCFMPVNEPGNTSAGTVSIFSGRLTTAKAGRSEAELTVANELVLLNVQMPRNLYQPTCIQALFDDDMLAQGLPPTGCKLIKASYANFLTVTGVTSASVFNTGATQADGYFSLGYLTFQSGENDGYTRAVQAYLNASGNFELTSPLPFTPSIGDTLTASPGCDHTQATCSTKFGNIVNFKGFPYVPNPTLAT